MKRTREFLISFFISIIILIFPTFLPTKTYCQDKKWNQIKQNENWEAVVAFKPPIEKRNIALSIYQLQESLMNPSNIKPETLLPITKIQGIIFDESGGIILLGVEEVGDGVVNICPDDIAIALRCMWRYSEPPGMSIDPRPDKNSLGGIGPVQDVVYFGGIKGTRIGLYAFKCDYWMKKLGAGKISTSLKGFQRYCDLAIKQLKVGANRFWFYPKESELIVSPNNNAMLLKKSGIQVLTEKEHYLVNKYRSHSEYRYVDPAAKHFADEITNRYDELCAEYTDLARLRNFFTLCEVFKWAEEVGIKPGIIKLEKWKHLLHTYQPVNIHTTPVVKTIETSFITGNLVTTIIGGVSCDIRLPKNPSIDYTGRLVAGVKNILSMRPSSSSLFWEYNFSSSPIIKINKNVLNERVKECKKASRFLKKGVIIDLHVSSEAVSLNVYKNGDRYEKGKEVADEFKDLLDVTSKTRGKLGESLNARWIEFYENNFAQFAKPTYYKTHEGKLVNLKPLLIIKSNEVNYKYSNIERVPILSRNFIIFIASKFTGTTVIQEASATDLVARINNIPNLSKKNTVFVFRLPLMDSQTQQEWHNAISELEKIIGRNNLLLNPDKAAFEKMMNNRNKEIIVIEFTHTNKGILLKDNQKYVAQDVLKSDDLSHIKYLLTGLGTCSLPRIERGEFAAALRNKGVGIINGSYGEVLSDIALQRLKQLIEILKNSGKYNIPAYYLIDIIDQILKIFDDGTINLGKIHQRCSATTRIAA